MQAQEIKLLLGVIVGAFIILHLINHLSQESCLILIDGSKVLIKNCNIHPDLVGSISKLKPFNHGLSS
nr:triple gene block protein 3 [Garlic yellow curl virus]